MKLIIAGGRDFQFTNSDYIELDFIHDARKITEVEISSRLGYWQKGRSFTQ